MQIKKILTPIDFSACAINAAKVAAQMVHYIGSGAELVLFHAVEPVNEFVIVAEALPTVVGQDREYLQTVRDIAKEKLQKLIDENDEFEGIKVSTEIVIGNFLTVVKEMDEKKEIDLIVVGSEGAEGFDEALIGSNTEKIIRMAHCPVLTIKKNITNFTPKRILFPTHLKSEQEAGLKYVERFAKLYKAAVHLVYINTPANFTSHRDIHQLKQAFMENIELGDYSFQIYSAINEEVGILHYAEDNDIDLIFMPTHQRTGLSHFFLGSVAENVANHASTAVLTLPMKYKF
ncbi:MAG: universal stress protein [Cytophagales bacterium]|nr:MAG: universal stress protein [Cytophagales bacterium]